MSGDAIDTMDVLDGRVRVVAMPRVTLLAATHALEDFLDEVAESGLIVAGFQDGADWGPQRERYEALAAGGRLDVTVLSTEPVARARGVRHLVLADAPVLADWFLVGMAAGVAVVLVGVGDPDAAEAPDIDAGWSFEPDDVRLLLDRILATVEPVDSATAEALRERVNAIGLGPVEARLATYFHSLVVARLGGAVAEQKQLREQERALLTRVDLTQRSLRRLERIAAIGATGSSLAHELNNPLMSIRMAVDTLREEYVDVLGEVPEADLTELTETIDLIGGAVSRMGRQIRDLFDGVERVGVAAGTIPLAPLLEDIVEEARHRFGREVRLAIAGEPAVVGDEDRLRYVLEVLLENADEADVDGGPLRVEVGVDSGMAEIAVIDAGDGISEDIGDALFKPFATTHVDRRGAGMSLALARRFAEDMDGALGLRPGSASETCFVLAVPLARASAPAPTPAPAEDEAGEPRPRRVLVVDDERDIRHLVGRVLRRSGWDVTEAATPAQAMDAIQLRNFDVLLLDFRLAEDLTADGLLERMETVRKNLRRRTVLITASLKSDVAAATYAAVLYKPFSRQDLLVAVERVGADPTVH